MKLADKHAVRFAKVMTCLNIGCPLGMGLWEGVPLREVFWLTRPREDVRRVFYYGYHNDDPAQRFQSSLPVGRVLEDHYDLPVTVWRELIQLHYPNTGWVRLNHDTLDALASYKSAHGMLGFDDAVTSLLAARTAEDAR